MDLVKMFRGLTPEQAKELTARITGAVEREYQNFKQGAEPMNDYEDLERRINALGDELRQRALQNGLEATANRLQGKVQTPGGNWVYPDGKQPPSQAKAYDPAAAEERLTRISQEYMQLSKDATKNADKLRPLEVEIRQLRDGQETYAQQVQAAQQAARQQEQDTLNAKNAQLADTLKELYREPTKNQAQIDALEKQWAGEGS